MKRVGISNFLRFFLHHPDVCKTYIDPQQCERQSFILIDLNNLVERSPLAFWTLTLKRIADTIQTLGVSESLKQRTQTIFTQAIQLGDTFFVLDAVQEVLRELTKEGFFTTLFLVRFDRLQDIITSEFFANIQAVKDVALQVSFVFTSYRPLHELVPDVFTRSSLSVFTQEMYLKPAKETDIRAVLSTFIQRYDLSLPQWAQDELLTLTGGHVQYLHLALIYIRDHGLPGSAKELFQAVSQHEEIGFLSEELWSSLTKKEQDTVLSMVLHPKETPELPRYVVETGMVCSSTKKLQLLNPLFKHFLSTLDAVEKETLTFSKCELSRKEHLLYSLLEEHLGNLVERDIIIQTVWADEAELGVSDWAVDRLVARLRAKLRTRRSEHKIVTVITRGYKLIHA